MNYIQLHYTSKRFNYRQDLPLEISLDTGSFVAVTPADAIAENDFSCFEVDGVAIVICRYNNAYFALRNECSHALASFADGHMKGCRLYCPLHGGAFDIRDGLAVGAPAKRPLETYPLRVADGVVEVAVSAAG